MHIEIDKVYLEQTRTKIICNQKLIWPVRLKMFSFTKMLRHSSDSWNNDKCSNKCADTPM